MWLGGKCGGLPGWDARGLLIHANAETQKCLYEARSFLFDNHLQFRVFLFFISSPRWLRLEGEHVNYLSSPSDCHIPKDAKLASAFDPPSPGGWVAANPTLPIPALITEFQAGRQSQLQSLVPLDRVLNQQPAKVKADNCSTELLDFLVLCIWKRASEVCEEKKKGAQKYGYDMCFTGSVLHWFSRLDFSSVMQSSSRTQCALEKKQTQKTPIADPVFTAC